VKPASIASLLSACALAGVALLYFRLDRLEERLDARRAEGSRTSPAEATPAWEPRPGEPLEAVHRAPPAAVSSDRPAGKGSGDALEAMVREAVDRRLAERPVPVASSVATPLPAPRFYRTVEDAAKDLELTPAQKDRMAAIVERARLRIDDVLRIPDEKGKSPLERREARMRQIRAKIEDGSPEGALGFVFAGAGELSGKIPGRDTTYAQETARIRKEAKEEIGALLEPRQREAFDKAHSDAMFGSEGEMSISVVTSMEGLAEDEGPEPSTR